MNINFEDVITKANKRKDDLVSLTTLLKEAPEMLSNLACIYAWVGAVRSVYDALDTEGRGMLPSGVQAALCSINSTRQSLADAIGDARAVRGLSRLVVKDAS